MVFTAVVQIIVFALTCYLVASEEQNLRDHRDISMEKKPGTSVEEEVSHPKKCKPVDACLSGEEAQICENASLPLLLFVVGIEGSGHHLVSSILYQSSLFTMQSHFVPQQHIYDDGSESTTLFYSIIEKELYEQRMQGLIQLMAKSKNSSTVATVVFASSFPMGWNAGTYATARPDLIDLKDFECKLYRIKFLVTRRHPLAAVMSAVRRFGTRITQSANLERIPEDKREGLDKKVLPYTVTARLSEENLIYIDQQIRQLGCHQVHFLDYDMTTNERTRNDSLQDLATFLELSERDTVKLLSTKVRKSNTKVTIPPTCNPCIQKTLYDFFEERKMMWPLLHPQ